MKVLIVRFSSIGDIVLTTPVIRALKVQKEATVHYLTKKSYEVLLKDNPYVDKILLLDNSLNDVIREIKKEKYDYLIDLHNNLRTRIIKLRTRVPAFSFDKINWQKWLMVNLKINKLPPVHIVDRYMETLSLLRVKTDSLGLDYFIPDKDEVPPEWLPEGFRKGYIVFAIGGQHETKKLPLPKMIELVDKINKPVILLGGKEDEKNGMEIEKFFSRRESTEKVNLQMDKLGKKAIVFNACGKFNLNQSASIIKQSHFVFTHDTGMMHVAAAFKKYVFSIWGNTIPAFGMYPYKTRFMVLENPRLECRPCSKIGYNKCPKGHFNCMNKIKFDFHIP